MYASNTAISPANLRDLPPTRVAAAAPATTVPDSPELLVNTSVALPRLADAIRGAREVINISMYSWLDSGSGATLARLVEQKALEGVEVNIMLDGRGSMVGPKLPGSNLVERMRAAGVNVIVNHSLVPLIDDPVDHCKVYSIDGAVGFLGGMNLSKTYDGWHDAMVTLDRYGAVQSGRDFLQRWSARGGAISDVNERLIMRPVNEPAPSNLRIIANHPGSQSAVTDAYMGAIATAQQRIWIETPFLGSRMLVDALAAAARRGVDVRVLTNGTRTNDAVPGVTLLGASFYADLTRAGVKVYQQQQMTHSKVMLADDQATIGSFNLTRRSQELHYEISMQSTARPLVAQVSAMFDADMGVAHLVTSADLQRPGQRMLTLMQRLLRIQY